MEDLRTSMDSIKHSIPINHKTYGEKKDSFLTQSVYNAKSLIDNVKEDNLENMERMVDIPNFHILKAMYENFPEIAHGVDMIVDNCVKWHVEIKDGEKGDWKREDSVKQQVEQKMHITDFLRASATDWLLYRTYIPTFFKFKTGVKLICVSPTEITYARQRNLEITHLKWNSTALHSSFILENTPEKKDFFFFSDGNSNDLFFGTAPLRSLYTKYEILSYDEQDFVLYYRNSSPFGLIFLAKEGISEEHSRIVKEAFLFNTAQKGRFTSHIMGGIESVQPIDQKPPKLVSKEDKDYIQMLTWRILHIPAELVGSGKGSNLQGSEKFVLMRQQFKEEAVDPVIAQLQNDLDNYIVPQFLTLANTDNKDISELISGFRIVIDEIQVEPHYLRNLRMQQDVANGILSVDYYLKTSYGILEKLSSLPTVSEEKNKELTVKDGTRPLKAREVSQTVNTVQSNQKSLVVKKKIKKIVSNFIGKVDLKESSVEKIIKEPIVAEISGNWNTILQKYYSQKEKDPTITISETLDTSFDEVVDKMLIIARMGIATAEKSFTSQSVAPLNDLTKGKVMKVINYCINIYLSNIFADDTVKKYNKKSLQEIVPTELRNLLETITQTEKTGDNEDLINYLISLLLVYPSTEGLDSTTDRTLSSSGSTSLSNNSEKRSNIIANFIASTMFNLAFLLTNHTANVKTKRWMLSRAKEKDPSHLASVGKKVLYDKRFVHNNGTSNFWSGERAGCLCDIRVTYEKPIDDWSKVKFRK